MIDLRDGTDNGQTILPIIEGEDVARGLKPSCFGCALSQNKSCGKFTEVEGGGRLGVLLVGEASGRQEAAAGLPFRPKAPAGSVLERALKEKGWSRDEFHITNIVRCHPPNDFLLNAPWERGAIDHCRTNLDEVVERVRPKAIVALGGIPTRELTGLQGEKLNVTYLRGYVLPSRYGIPVIPTFHPSYLGRGTMKYFGLLMRDISRAVTVAMKGIVPCYDLTSEIECRTGIEDLREIYERALADPSLPICVDCETEESKDGDEDEVVEFARDLEAGRYIGDSNEGDGDSESVGDVDEDLSVQTSISQRSCSVSTERSQLRTIQFAVDRNWGVSVPWAEGYRELALLILELPNPKLTQNGDLFDWPVLRKHGAVINGDSIDLLTLQKTLQPDLPGHLQATSLNYRPTLAPWKHLAGTNLEMYGVIDVAVLPDIYAGLQKDMKKIVGPNGVSVWEGYERWVQPMRGVLDRMTQRGLPVDKVGLDALREWIEEELRRIEGELQGQIPDHLRQGELKEGCKALPKDVKEWLILNRGEIWAPTYKEMKNGKTKTIKAKVQIGLIYDQLMSNSVDWQQSLESICTELGYTVREFVEVSNGSSVTLKRLVKLKDWNPASSKQMIEYLKWRKYPIPTRFKDGKPTTGDKELEKLWRKTKDPVLKLSRDKRATAKLRDSYTGKLGEDGVARGGWIPGADGRLRATIKLTSATWQLKSSNPNVMTLPTRREELAKRFKACMKAEPGHQMIELDFSAFHAKTTALEAQDPDWMRLAGLDIHSYVAGWMVKWKGIETALDMHDEDLRQYLAEIKSVHKQVRNVKAKPALLGIGYSMGYRRLYFENSESFANETEAKKLLDLIKRLFPKIFKWQDIIIEKAANERKLVSKWGAVRWFWSAMDWKQQDGRWIRTKGSQAEAAVAFLPSNDAHGMLRMKLIEMDRWGWLERYGLSNIIHDAVLFHCPNEWVEECLAKVKPWLEAPVEQLADPVVAIGGFRCLTEAKVGKDLSDMVEVKI